MGTISSILCYELPSVELLGLTISLVFKHRPTIPSFQTGLTPLMLAIHVTT